ncbi:hypothetical protein [Aquimarina algiphila]|uniref:hypothetical protein n=1 Tax=Aquimarina algiphila TaxID=2047982 RepID=UPI00249142C4|nr:hypothetical protein [Aquimarina algiphila]
MSKKTILTLFICFTSLTIFSQKENFTGIWKMSLPQDYEEVEMKFWNTLFFMDTGKVFIDGQEMFWEYNPKLERLYFKESLDAKEDGNYYEILEQSKNQMQFNKPGKRGKWILNRITKKEEFVGHWKILKESESELKNIWMDLSINGNVSIGNIGEQETLYKSQWKFDPQSNILSINIPFLKNQKVDVILYRGEKGVKTQLGVKNKEYHALFEREAHPKQSIKNNPSKTINKSNIVGTWEVTKIIENNRVLVSHSGEQYQFETNGALKLVINGTEKKAFWEYNAETQNITIFEKKENTKQKLAAFKIDKVSNTQMIISEGNRMAHMEFIR